MAFDPSTPAYSLFPTFPRQASVNGGVVSHPSVSILEQDASLNMHRSHSAHEDPFGLINCAQSNIKIRQPTDNTDSDRETGMQRLVSSIVEEADSQDSFFSDRSRSCNPLRFQMMEELPKYSHLEIKSQQNHIFPQNHVFPEAFGKTQEQSVSKDFEEIFQQTNGTTANQQWLFNLPIGDRDSHSQNTQKLPLGQPNSRNNYIPQKQQGKPDYTSPFKEGVDGQPLNHFPDLSDVLGSEREKRSPCFNPYEDPFSQSNAQLISIDQHTPKEFIQQVKSLQSLMAGENNTLCPLDFPNIHRQPETTAEQRKIIASAMPSQLGRSFGTDLMEQNGENSQIVYHHAFQDQPGFSPQNTNYFEQTKPSFASSVEGVHARPLTSADMPKRDEKRGLPQKLFFEPLENMQFKRSDEENNMIRAANAQMHRPHTWPMNDSRRMPNITFNSSNSRPTRPYGRAVSGMDMGDMRSANESAAFNFYDRGMMTRRGESNYHGNPPAMTTSVMMNQGYSVFQLNLYFDECSVQWRCLERERKKTQAILSLTFPGKTSAPVTNAYNPQTPPHPSGVDCLIVKLTREHARVASLLDQMECLGNFSLHTDIRTALIKHNIAICLTHARFQEIANMSKHQCQSAHFTKDRDTLLMAPPLKDLAATTRKLRTALWCALQRTLPRPAWRQEPEQHAARRSPSPFEGCSFYAVTGTKHEVKI